MKPFNLEKALAGDPVVTRDGRVVTEIVHLKTNIRPIIAVIDGRARGYLIDGTTRSANDWSQRDLFMAPKKTTYYQLIFKRNGVVAASTLSKKPITEDNIRSEMFLARG